MHRLDAATWPDADAPTRLAVMPIAFGHEPFRSAQGAEKRIHQLCVISAAHDLALPRHSYPRLTLSKPPSPSTPLLLAYHTTLCLPPASSTKPVPTRRGAPTSSLPSTRHTDSRLSGPLPTLQPADADRPGCNCNRHQSTLCLLKHASRYPTLPLVQQCAPNQYHAS